MVTVRALLLALAVSLFTAQPESSRPSFAEFLAGVRAEALSRGIREAVLDEALADIGEPSAVVIERDRTQAEAVLPLEKYVDQRLMPRQIAAGREMLARHHDLLEEIGAAYGVPPALIVGILGLESNFGRFSGVRPTIAALATLAWDPRRSALFRRELFAALEILNRGDIEFPKLRGSWAGAMGQVQFIPSSYLKFAVDYDGDGRRDIWATPADVFASIANYMQGHGWAADATWGREVKISGNAKRRIANEVERRDGTCQARRDMTTGLPVERWRALGVRTLNGQRLPPATPNAALVSGRSRSFLVYQNYDALLEYNCAHSYAIAAGLLADRIGARQAPRGEPTQQIPKAPQPPQAPRTRGQQAAEKPSLK